MKNLIFLSLLLGFTSCKIYVPFTQTIKNDMENNGIDVSKTQFYFDKMIILERKIVKSEIEIDKGDITRNKKQTRDVVRFGTPYAKIKAVGNELLGVMNFYFEQGIPIVSRIKEGEYYIFYGVNDVVYDGEIYNIKQGQNNMAYISKKDYTKYSKNLRKVKGLSVE